jgi:hypothetical protein
MQRLVGTGIACFDCAASRAQERRNREQTN